MQTLSHVLLKLKFTAMERLYIIVASGIVYMFCAIWEFAQSRDCVAHSRNPEIVQAISGLRNTCAQSRDCVTHVRNLEIA